MNQRLPIAQIKEAALASLYEHLLTADAESHWFLLDDVRELIRPQPSGALLRIAFTALKNEGLIDITYEDGETDLFTLTPRGIEEAEKLHGRYFDGSDDVLEISTQKGRVEKIRLALDALEKELRESNELSSELSENDKDLMSGEVSAARTLVQRKRFRLSRLVALVLPLLRTLADKFSGSAIGEVAKHLIGLLLP